MSKTILLMEDDPSLHYLVKHILQQAGYNLLSAYSGDEGLKVLSSEKPDLVVLDNMMPGRSGEEVFEEVMSNDVFSAVQKIPFVMLTAKQMKNDKVKTLLEKGMAAFLMKPFGHKELLNIIQNIMTTHEIQVREQNLYRAISNSKDFLSNLVDNIPDALFIVDLEGKISFYNGGQRDLLGYDADSLENSHIDSIIASSSLKLERLVERVGTEGTLANLEIALIKKDQEPAPFRISVASLNDQQESLIGLILIGSDISEIKRLEMELVEKEKLSMFLETAIAINHEINNPLAPIMGNVQLILEDKDNLDPMTCRRLEVIQRNATRIHEITQKLSNIKTPKQTSYIGDTKMVDIFESE